MAASCYPIRSVSLPSKSNDNVLRIEETIKSIKSCDLSTASTVQVGFSNLVGLYSQVQELMLLPSSSSSSHQRENVEKALESSGWLIDCCSGIRDVMSRLKSQVRDLQSALRRKGCAGVEAEIKAYVCLRKKLGRDVARWVKEIKLKHTEERLLLLGMSASNLDLLSSLLTEVYAVTVDVFRAMFSLLAVPSKGSGWLAISRLVVKRVKSAEELGNEVVSVDVALHGVRDGVVIRERIEALDAGIVGLEGELECLSRCLVQNRVSLLNVLTP